MEAFADLESRRCRKKRMVCRCWGEVKEGEGEVEGNILESEEAWVGTNMNTADVLCGENDECCYPF